MEGYKVSFTSLCFELSKLPEEARQEFFNSISGSVTEEEKNAILFGVSYFRMLTDKNLEDSIKDVLSTALYKHFTEGE